MDFGNGELGELSRSLDMQVLLLMRNLTINLSSADFEPVVSIIFCEISQHTGVSFILCFANAAYLW